MSRRLQSKNLLSALIVPAALMGLGGWAEAQGAWTQPEGAAFLQFSLQRIGPYDEIFRDSGPDFVPGRELTELTLEVYGEYGLEEGLTLIGVLPIKFLDAGPVDANATIQPTTIESGSETSLGNILLGVRKTLSQGNLDVAGQIDVEFPTGSLDRRTGLSSGLDAFTIRPTISLGRGFGRTYVQGYAGLGLRTDDFSNDWRIGFETGYRFDRFLLAGNLDVVHSFSDGDVQENARNLETRLYLDEQEVVAYGFKWLYEVSSRFGVQGAVRFASSGNNVAKSPYLSLGVYFRW